MPTLYISNGGQSVKYERNTEIHKINGSGKMNSRANKPATAHTFPFLTAKGNKPLVRL